LRYYVVAVVLDNMESVKRVVDILFDCLRSGEGKNVTIKVVEV